MNNSNSEKIPAIDIVGETCAPPPRKWRVKRSSSGKSIEIVWEKEESSLEELLTRKQEKREQ